VPFSQISQNLPMEIILLVGVLHIKPDYDITPEIKLQAVFL